jgi:hypothetical protein
MQHAIRVARVTELPPGKGKVVELDGREITVYNAAGRLVATATRAPHPHGGAVGCGSAPGGLGFDAFAEDSPADLLVELRCRVWIHGDDVWMSLD